MQILNPRAQANVERWLKEAEPEAPDDIISRFIEYDGESPWPYDLFIFGVHVVNHNSPPSDPEVKKMVMRQLLLLTSRYPQATRELEIGQSKVRDWE